jgi:outer membrane autotransporter protein
LIPLLVRFSRNSAGIIGSFTIAFFSVAHLCNAQIDVYGVLTGINNSPGYVSFFDSQTNAPVGSPLTVGNQPWGSAVTPDGRYAYTANVGSNTLTVIDMASRSVTGTISGVGIGPSNVTVSPDGKFVYVANQNSNNVSIVDVATSQVVGSPISVGNTPLGIAVTPDGKFLYVSSFFDGAVKVIDTSTRTVVATIPGVGSNSFNLAISPNGQFAYVVNEFSNNVSVINTATRQVVNTVGVGFAPLGIAFTPDGKFAYVANQGDSVSVVNTATQTVVDTISVGFGSAIDVSITPDGKFAYITVLDAVEIINLATNTVVGSIPFGGGAANQTGSFLSPNIIVANGGPLSVANDAALSSLGFGRFVDFNGGTLRLAGNLATSRTISLLLLGGTIDTNGFNAIVSGNIINSGSLTKTGAGTLTLTGSNTYSGGTTISAGILQLGNGGASGSIVGNVVDNGVFAINRSDAFTFGGVISGTGSFQQLGTGTTILTAANSYSGGTTISAGVLDVSADNNLGAASGGLTFNGGTLQFGSAFNLASTRTITLNGGGGTFDTNGFSTTISQGITGIGGLTKAGDGVLILTGTNNYTGGTTITAGVLIAGSTTALSPASAFTVNGTLDLGGFSNTIGALNGLGTVTNSASPQQNAVLTVGQPGSTASGLFSGVIQDGLNSTVGLNLAGGVLVLTGSNTYTGGTTISGGVLDVSADNNLGAVSGGLSFNGGTLQFGSAFHLASTRTITLNGGGGTFDTNGFNISISQGITGIGGLTKTGPGTLTLSGSNSYSGGTVLNAGILVVNNTQALGLGDVTVNVGILKADPQPINVKGNYTQNAGGTLLLQVAGPGPGQYDFLNVSGNANLGGTLQLTNLGYKPKVGDQLTLVRTGGSITGPFPRWVNPFTTGPGINTIDLIYSKKAVTLAFLNLIPPVPPVGATPPPVVITTINFASFAETPNQGAAASLLDGVQLNPRASNLMSFFYKEPFANLPSDFTKISPESLTAFYEISFSGANIQRLSLENRLEDIRDSSIGANGTGATVYLEDKADGKSSKNRPVLPPVQEKRWDFWSTGFGDFVHVDSDFNAHGYKFTTGGIDLGIDYRLTDHLAFGLMGSYAHTWSDLRPGSIDVDSGRGGIYATYFNNCFYLNGGIYGGYNSYDSSRRGLQGNANGNSDGAEFSTFVSGGYDIHFGHLTIGPIASLQYTNVYLDGFREKGSLAPLSIHSDSEESLRSDFGFRASYQWQVGTVQVEPFLKATWEHEFKYSTLPITAGFADVSGPSATFLGPAEGHDSAVVDAGISVSWTKSVSTYVSYNGLLGRDRYNSNGVSGGIRITF